MLLKIITSDSTVVGFDRRTTKRKEKSVETYDEAIGNLNTNEPKDSKEPILFDDVGSGTHCCQRPIRKVTKDTLVGIGKV